LQETNGDTLKATYTGGNQRDIELISQNKTTFTSPYSSS